MADTGAPRKCTNCGGPVKTTCKNSTPPEAPAQAPAPSAPPTAPAVHDGPTKALKSATNGHGTNGHLKPKRERPQVVLIPWDPESEEHCERLRIQRVACGWKSEKIGYWRGCQRKGVMSLHWVVVPESEARLEGWLKDHIKAYPDEAKPLEDTATAIGGKPRDNSSSHLEKSFTPLGHISIDTITSTYRPSPLMADPSTGRYHLSAFYVSRALHNSGIGSSSILSAEAMAVSVLGAKVITLDTVDRRVVVPESEGGWPWARERMLRLQGWGPKFSVQEWYERLGYRVFWEEGEQARGSSYAVGAGSCKPKSIVGEVNTKEVEKTEKGGKEGALEDEEGEWWVIPSVWMEKVLV